MHLAKKLEPFQTLLANMPSIEHLPIYAGGLLKLVRTGLGIRLAGVLHKEELAAQGSAYFDGVESVFFEEMSAYILNELHWELELEGDLPEKPGGRWVYIMNHPTLLATWTPLDLASRTMAPNTAVIAKSELIEHQLTAFLLGKPLKDIGRVGFIKRDNRQEAYEGVRQAVETVFRPNTGLVLFPDAHRPYPPRIKKEREGWDTKIPEVHVKDWMTETCFPRSGGLWNLLRATEGMEDVRYMNFTVAEPKRSPGRFHIAIQELSREEMLGHSPSLEHLKEWLIADWKEKNNVIRGWNGGR